MLAEYSLFLKNSYMMEPFFDELKKTFLFDRPQNTHRPNPPYCT